MLLIACRAFTLHGLSRLYITQLAWPLLNLGYCDHRVSVIIIVYVTLPIIVLRKIGL